MLRLNSEATKRSPINHSPGSCQSVEDKESAEGLADL